MDPYLKFLGLVALLFFLPKTLMRFGLPSPVTEIALGAGMAMAGLSSLGESEIVKVLSGIGVSSLFLFAGVEVEVPELLKRRWPLLQHLTIQILLFALAASVAGRAGLQPATAALVGVAVMTPSAGFILPALEGFGLASSCASWIKQKAIATEIFAIVAVLALSNSASREGLLVGVGGVLVLIALLPLAFVAFHIGIRRSSPRTELSFVMVVALFAAYLTHHLGVHYMVGAFVVGLAARRYLDWGSSRGANLSPVFSALSTLRFFSSFFVPFYFFSAGLHLPGEAVSWQALLFLIVLCASVIPLRIGAVMLHRRWTLRESWGEARNVGLFLGPTLVFSLAVAEILRNRFQVPGWWVGGLVLYGAATSFLPLLTHKVRSMEFEDVLGMVGPGQPVLEIRPPAGGGPY